MKHKHISSIFLLLVILNFNTQAQLTGIKTIGGSSPDYATFTDAVNALVANNVGTGGVIFNIRTDTFTEQVVIPSISGVSGTNTITFQSESGNNTDVVLTAAPTLSSDNYTLRLDGADYIILKDMTIASAGDTYGSIIEILDINDFSISNCRLIGSTSPTLIQGRAIFVQNYSSAQNYTIDNNLFQYGERGILVNADPAYPLTNLTITNNRFIEQIYMGMLINGSSAPLIRENEIYSPATGSFYGIEVKSCASTMIVEKNIVTIPYASSGRGIYSYECNGTSGNEGLIANNFVHVNSELTGTDCYGIRNRESTFQKIYHNSVHVTGTYLSSKGLLINSLSSDVEVLNNIFTNDAQGYAIYSETSTNINSDYNNLTTNGNYLGFWVSQDLSDLPTWSSVSGQGSNSISVDPEYFNISDLHASNQSLKAGIYKSLVPDDIDGDSRSITTPCIGADEFTEGSLSGTYPLGSSASEFKTFNDAVTALVTRKIRGAVIFEVESGNYYEQVVMPEIEGASESQTITFRSATGDSTDVIWDYAPAGSLENFTIQLNGADHFIFGNMTLSSTGTSYARVINILNESTHNLFLNNHIKGISTTSTLDALALIFSSANQDSSNIFQGNFIESGSYGFYYEGDNGNHEVGTQIKGNIFKDQYANGIYFQYEKNPLIYQNTFTTNSSNTNYAAIYMRYLSDKFFITENNLLLEDTKGGFGIFLYLCKGKTGKEGIVANNFIVTGTTGNSMSGIHLRYSDTVSILYNTVIVKGSISNSHAIYLYDLNNYIKIYNNILVNETGAYSFTSNNSSDLFSDHNNLYTSGDNLGSWNSSDQADLSAWQTASGLDASSLSVDPQFVAADDPHFPNPLLNDAGTPVDEVTDDIDGEMRDPTTPDIGADEFCLPPVADDKSGCTTRSIPDLTAVGNSIKWYSDGTLTTMVHSGNNFPTGHTAAGAYTYFATQTINESESQADTVILTINTTPGLPSASDETICFDESTPDLTAFGTDLKWYDDEALTNQVHAGTPFATGETDPGTYSYYVTQTQDGCESNPDTSVLTIHPIPDPPDNTRFISCYGDNVPDLVAEGENIQWYSDEALITPVHTGDTFSSGDTLAGSYPYFPTQTVFGCESGPAYDTLRIKPRPGEPLADSQSVCIGENIPDLSAIGTDIKWYEDAGRETLLHGGNTYPTGETEVGIYPCYVTQTVDGCESLNKPVALAINGLPDPFVLEDKVICEVDTQEFQLSAAVAGHSYSWTSSQGDLTSSEADPVVKPTVPGSFKYFLTETIDSTGCLDRDTVTITIHPDPPATVLADQVLCYSEIRAFQIGASAIAGNSYSWISNPAGFVNTEANPSVTPTESRTYILTETINLTGCNKTNSVTFTINPNPDATVLDNQIICYSEIQEFQLSAAAAVAGHSYLWTSNPGGFTSTQSNPKATPTVTTEYTLTETIDATGCKNTNPVMITINPNPVVSITAGQNPIDQDSSTSLNASGASTYQWSPATGLSSTTESQVTADPDEITTYYLEGTNIYGCTDTDSITLYVYCPECSDETYFTVTGTFNFGCTNNLYKNNLNCSWTILPSGVDSIYLDFKLPFDIREGDYVRVYNGGDATAPLIGEYNNVSLPPDLITSGSAMFVQFVTNDQDAGLGFQAEWSNVPIIDNVNDVSTDRIKIYPNPANDKLFIEINDLTGKDLRLFIYNHLGQMILNRQLEYSGGQIREELDISDFRAGMYHLIIFTEKEIINQKFIKE